MALEALRAAIEEEGRARADAVLRDGEARAARIRAEAAEEAGKRRRQALEREEAALRREAGARIAAARRSATRQVLEARESLINRVFARALASAPAALASPAGRAWLVARVPQALAHLPPGAVTVRGSSEVAPWLDEAVTGREGVRVECDPDLPAGFRAIGAGGSLMVDGTLERLLELRRPELSIGVLGRLEAPETAG